MNIENYIAVLKALHENDVEYVLVGGLAAILHGVPRITEDIDIFLQGGASNIEKLKAALASVFNDKSIEEISTRDLESYSVIRYGTPGDFYIDIMIRIGERFAYSDLEYEIIKSHGIPIRIATVQTLINMKQGTLREIDRADVILLTEKLKGKK